jgi:E3 ubiquitin-protein ligase RNF115/126
MDNSFMQRRPGDAGITGPIMARYLMALLGREHLTDMFARGMADGPQAGRMGDYVFNQEGWSPPATASELILTFCKALDQIITQLMETSNSSRPVPATDEIVEKLPREVLEVGCASLFLFLGVTLTLFYLAPTLDKDCAVCKDPFKLDTEDPSEQIVVTLPCSHPFHEPCILPWLKSSGTCPVCRYLCFI